MSIPSAQNGEEAGYLALAAVNELIGLLISKQVIGDTDVTVMLRAIVGRLKAAPNDPSKRAAAVLARAIDVEK